MSESALTDLPIERLEAAIASLAVELTVRLERWLAMVAEFDRRGGARRWGFRGTAEWLAWRCGLSQRTARDHVRVARAIVERPLVRRGLARGELSYSKVRALARVPAGGDEVALVDLARGCSAGEVERVVRGLRCAPSAGLDAARHSHARRFVDWWWEPDGSLSVRGRLPAEDGAAFIAMIETAAAALHAPPALGIADEELNGPATPDRDRAAAGIADEELNDSATPSPHESAVGIADEASRSDDMSAGDERGALAGDQPPRRPPLGARRADALAEVAHSGSPRTQVVLHVDAAALAATATDPAERAGATCALEDGPAIPSETARRLACDATLLIARHAGDGTVDYGRARRVVPAPLRTVLERRDRRCRYPGCEHSHDLHAHHIEHWAHGGTTHKDNLLLLCRFHHRLLHEDGFTIQHTRDGTLTFHRPDHQRVPETPPHTHDPARAREHPIAA